MEHTRSNNPRHDRGVTWVLDLAVSADVLVPDGCGAGRDAFIEWLWGTLGAVSYTHLTLPTILRV